MQDRRREQIIDAFITLVAARGLEGLSLDDVAAAAEVQRTAVRHFVGNRSQLITAAVEEITRRAVDDDLRTPPTFTKLAAQLFSADRIKNLTAEADAWQALLPEALRLPEARAMVKSSWDRLMSAIADALRSEYPGAGEAGIRDTAYVIACLAEQDFTFQLLGYPRARSTAALNAALRVAEHLQQ